MMIPNLATSPDDRPAKPANDADFLRSFTAGSLSHSGAEATNKPL
jgi:hypothetical protein